MSTTTHTAINLERILIIQIVDREAPAPPAAPQPRGAVEYAQMFWRGFMWVERDPAELRCRAAKGVAYAAGSLVFGELVWLIKRQLTQSRKDSVAAERVKDLGAVYLSGWLHLDPYNLFSFCGNMKTDIVLHGSQNRESSVRSIKERDHSSEGDALHHFNSQIKALCYICLILA